MHGHFSAFSIEPSKYWKSTSLLPVLTFFHFSPDESAFLLISTLRVCVYRTHTPRRKRVCNDAHSIKKSCMNWCLRHLDRHDCHVTCTYVFSYSSDTFMMSTNAFLTLLGMSGCRAPWSITRPLTSLVSISDTCCISITSTMCRSMGLPSLEYARRCCVLQQRNNKCPVSVTRYCRTYIQ